jgi:hypothetical protein
MVGLLATDDAVVRDWAESVVDDYRDRSDPLSADALEV